MAVCVRRALLLATLLLCLSIGLTQQPPLNNAAVIDMEKNHVSEPVIKWMINSHPGNYELGPSDIAKLKQIGTTDEIIAAMAAKSKGGRVLSDANSYTTGPQGSIKELEHLIDSKRYVEFSERFEQATDIPPDQRSYFKGILANKRNLVTESRSLLADTLTATTSTLNTEEIKEAYRTLVDDDIKLFHYSDAVNDYRQLQKRLGSAITSADLDYINERRHTLKLIQEIPPQTIKAPGAFSINIKNDAIGLIQTPVQVSANQESAVLDTGAVYSMVSRTVAERWGLKPLAGSIRVNGFGGNSFSASPAVVPVLQIGSAELHNVVVLIADDKALYIPQIHYQISAIVGYPVLSALGRLTFSNGKTLTVSPQISPAAEPKPSPIEEGARLWLDGSAPLVAADTIPVSRAGAITGSAGPRLFTLDTGAGNTYFTDKYYREHQNDFVNQPVGAALLAGGGGSRSIPAYTAKGLPLWFGSTLVVVRGVHVLKDSQGGSEEDFYGNLGQDLLRSFDSYTIDFHSMRFIVTPRNP